MSSFDLDKYVYTGIWTNWADGPIFGATLTLTSRNGKYLIAFLALFVRLIGSHFWSLISHGIFHIRATNKPRTGLHHQHQAIFRNAGSDLSALWQFLITGWAWRQRLKGSLAISGVYVVLAFLNLALFAAAGIFSSSVAKNSADVLLKRSSSCGDFELFGRFQYQRNSSPLSPDVYSDLLQSWSSYRTSSLAQISSYLQYCNSILASDDCISLGRRSINLTASIIRNCPFDESICMNDTTVRLDTGVVDSLLDLGINTNKQNRVGWRNVVECSPIATEGYRTGMMNASDPRMASILNIPTVNNVTSGMMYLYGNGSSVARNVNGDEYNRTGLEANLTYLFGVPPSVRSRGLWGNFDDLSGYKISAVSYYPNLRPYDGFAPIDALLRTDADVSLYFLSSNVLYTEPVHDPWFLSPYPRHTRDNVTYFVSGQGVRVIGCIDQGQTCNVGTGRCSNFRHALERPGDASLNWTPTQQSILLRPHRTILPLIIQYTGSMLLANQVLNGVWSEPLPQDQWIKEFQNFINIMLTNRALSSLDYVTGPRDPRFTQYFIPAAPKDEWMCSKQITQSRAFTSFSILGLCIIFFCGGIVIVTNLGLESMLDYMHQPRGFAALEWKQSCVLQLQRYAFEGEQKGTWDSLNDRVPVGARGEKFTPLYDNDEKPARTPGLSRLPPDMHEDESVGLDNFSYHGIHDNDDDRDDQDDEEATTSAMIEMTPDQRNFTQFSRDASPVTESASILGGGHGE